MHFLSIQGVSVALTATEQQVDCGPNSSQIPKRTCTQAFHQNKWPPGFSERKMVRLTAYLTGITSMLTAVVHSVAEDLPLLLQQAPKSLSQGSATILRALLDPNLKGMAHPLRTAFSHIVEKFLIPSSKHKTAPFWITVKFAPCRISTSRLVNRVQGSYGNGVRSWRRRSSRHSRVVVMALPVFGLVLLSVTDSCLGLLYSRVELLATTSNKTVATEPHPLIH